MLTIILRLSLASVLTLAVLAGGSTVLLSQPAADGDTPFALTDDDGQSWPGAGSALSTRRTLDIQRKADERLRRFPDSPHTVGWLWQAERFDDALDVLARVVERQPMQLPAALSGAAVLVTAFQPDQARRYRPRLQSVAASARAALSSLDREQAAKVAAALIPIEGGGAEPPVGHDVLVDWVIAEYPDTEAARLLEVDRITRGGVTQAQLDALDAFAAKQPGTVVAAKARYLKGFHLAHNRTSLVRGGASPDPTDSFLELLDIVADLESGRYPACTWVDDAPGLVTDYRMFQPVIAPENATRMIGGIVRFAREHPALVAEPNGRLTYLLSNTMARVAAFLPDGPEAMQRALANLEEALPDAGPARLARAAWLGAQPGAFIGPAALAPPSPTREADIRALLAEAASSSNTAVATLALATLAEREFGDPSSRSSALSRYREYERRFPSADNTWIAALRAGQVEYATGRHEDAIASFLRAADSYAADALARTLALAYAGQLEEERDGFDAAARYYRMAVGGWAADMGDMIALDLPIGRTQPPPQDTVVKRTSVQRTVLEQRVAEIGRSLPVQGGVELERGRWLLAHERAREAVRLLSDVSRRFGTLSTGMEARIILRRARLDAAVDLAADDPPRRADALKELDSLAAEPADAAGRTAGIVAATLRMLDGDTSRADKDLRRTLEQSISGASRTGSRVPAGSLEADVLAIRDAVFHPLGHAVFGTQFTSWPSALPAFIIAPSSLQVTTADGVKGPVDVSRQPPGLTNALFLTADDVKYLATIVTRLGGSERRVPTAVMEVPNQPMGSARAIIEWWNRFFPTRPGHWTGVEILTYPAFSSIEFTNAERTRALVPFAVGYSGSTVVLEKVNGVWTMKELLGFWIT